MSVIEVFEIFAKSIAEIDPEKVSKLHAPKAMVKRVELLISKKKEGKLSPDENTELERYLTLDLIINLAKARALRHLNAA